MSFTPSPGYQIVLDRLLAARVERDISVDLLAQRLDLTVAEIEAFEAGKVRLDFAQTRAWCLALRLPFTEFVLAVAELMADLNQDALSEGAEAPPPHLTAQSEVQSRLLESDDAESYDSGPEGEAQ